MEGTGYVKTTLLTLLVTLGLCSGCTTSHIHRSTSANPLPAMATFARANDYNVLQSETNNLQVRKNVNWGMLFLGRRDRFVGKYMYNNSILDAEVYLAMTEWWGLGPTTTMELKPQFLGCAVTPFARECSEEMLKAGGMSPEWP